jgi:peptidoglycan/LPS O-acetylase OafA/YrhL
MRISLVFPFMALAVIRLKVRWAILAALVLSFSFFPLAQFLSSTLHLCTQQAALSSTITLHYAAFFVIGSLLAKNLHHVNEWYRRLHPLVAALFAFAAFALYCFADASSIVQHFSIPGDLYDWPVAAGAVMIMILAMNATMFHAFLTSRFIHHLGKISYSLYLVHGTVLLTLFHTLDGRIPQVVLLLIYLGTTLAITEVFYSLIEHPTMLLGRRLTTPSPLKQ